jgi:hypothetical protein
MITIACQGNLGDNEDDPPVSEVCGEPAEFGIANNMFFEDDLDIPITGVSVFPVCRTHVMRAARYLGMFAPTFDYTIVQIRVAEEFVS